MEEEEEAAVVVGVAGLEGCIENVNVICPDLT